ncbi:MAG: short-chain dehydrogenase/reductase [Gemmatimonadetes bacterium]|nr:short-chain dehydrogenase/reductase [Gemmatimonadota bacterium]
MGDQDRPLAGRTALVTGASRGIGAAVARKLAAGGARVALLARSETALHTLAREIGQGSFVIACDVGALGAAELAAGAIEEATKGGPDILVNNAGAFLVAPAGETSVEQFRDTLEVNLVAPFSFARIFLAGMRLHGRGHIVTVGSIADRSTFPGNAAYAASKYGLRALHEVLRAELRGSGVRATLVSPGPVDTELWDPIDPDRQPGFTPRARMLDADAVAAAVHYAVTAPNDVNVDELRLSRA